MLEDPEGEDMVCCDTDLFVEQDMSLGTERCYCKAKRRNTRNTQAMDGVIVVVFCF